MLLLTLQHSSNRSLGGCLMFLNELTTCKRYAFQTHMIVCQKIVRRVQVIRNDNSPSVCTVKPS